MRTKSGLLVFKNHSWREKKRLEAEQALTQTEKQSKCKQRFGSRTKDYIVKLPSATPLVWLWSKNSFFGHGKTKSQLGFSFISSWCKKTLPAFILIVLQQQTWTNTTPRHQNRHSEPMKPRGKRYQTIKKMLSDQHHKRKTEGCGKTSEKTGRTIEVVGITHRFKEREFTDCGEM